MHRVTNSEIIEIEQFQNKIDKTSNPSRQMAVDQIKEIERRTGRCVGGKNWYQLTGSDLIGDKQLRDIDDPRARERRIDQRLNIVGTDPLPYLYGVGLPLMGEGPLIVPAGTRIDERQATVLREFLCHDGRAMPSLNAASVKLLHSATLTRIRMALNLSSLPLNSVCRRLAAYPTRWPNP
jgi:hypothetical protein